MSAQACVLTDPWLGEQDRDPVKNNFLCLYFFPSASVPSSQLMPEMDLKAKRGEKRNCHICTLCVNEIHIESLLCKYLFLFVKNVQSVQLWATESYTGLGEILYISQYACNYFINIKNVNIDWLFYQTKCIYTFKCIYIALYKMHICHKSGIDYKNKNKNLSKSLLFLSTIIQLPIFSLKFKLF